MASARHWQSFRPVCAPSHLVQRRQMWRGNILLGPRTTIGVKVGQSRPPRSPPEATWPPTATADHRRRPYQSQFSIGPTVIYTFIAGPRRKQGAGDRRTVWSTHISPQDWIYVTEKMSEMKMTGWTWIFINDMFVMLIYVIIISCLG